MKKLLNRIFGRRPVSKQVAAHIAPTAVLHPGSEIANLLGVPANISVGEHSHVRGQLLLFWESGEIRIGEWSYIGHGSRIWSRASVRIGNYVLISHLVDIHDTDGHPLDWQQRREDIRKVLGGVEPKMERNIGTRPVVIEDDVWIGAKAIVLKGVTIGRGAVVAAGAVVTKDVPPFTLVAGNPAQVTRQLTQ